MSVKIHVLRELKIVSFSFFYSCNSVTSNDPSNSFNNKTLFVKQFSIDSGAFVKFTKSPLPSMTYSKHRTIVLATSVRE